MFMSQEGTDRPYFVGNAVLQTVLREVLLCQVTAPACGHAVHSTEASVHGNMGGSHGKSQDCICFVIQVDKVLQSYTRIAGKPFGGSAAEYDKLQQYVAKQSGSTFPPREALEKM